MLLTKKTLVGGKMKVTEGGGVNPYAPQQTQEESQAKESNVTPDDVDDRNPLDTLKAKMRAKNKYEWQMDLNLLGDLTWTAGNTVLADKSFGAYSRVYLIDKVCHRVARQGSGYSCNVEGHGVLTGY